MMLSQRDLWQAAVIINTRPNLREHNRPPRNLFKVAEESLTFTEQQRYRQMMWQRQRRLYRQEWTLRHLPGLRICWILPLCLHIRTVLPHFITLIGVETELKLSTLSQLTHLKKHVSYHTVLHNDCTKQLQPQWTTREVKVCGTNGF